VGVVASLRDITERKRAQEARRRSEERFRLLVESVEDYAIFLLDTDGRVVSWNAGAERIKGYLADEIIGHHFSAFYPEEDRRRNKPERALRVAAAEGRFEDEGWRVRKDGSRFWADALITAVRDEAGRLRGFAKVTRDLTERKRAEHVLRGQKTALTRTIHALTAEPELDAFLGQVLTAVAEQFDSCSTSLWFCDAAQDTVSLHMTCGARIPSGEQPCPTAGSGPLPARDVPLWQELMRTRQPLVIEDVARDPRITRCPGLAPPDAQTLLLVPLLLGDEAIGWLSIANARNRGFQPEEIELAQALAQQATLAVQLTGLAEQGQQAAVLAERNRMAREIHDTLAQGFTGILIQLEAAEDTLTEEPEAAQAHIARARDLARQSLAEARRSVWALRSQALEGSSLPGTLANLTRQMIFGTHMHMEFHVHGTPRSLPADTESNLLRIGLEALTNALKHAEATAIRVELSFASGQVRLSVQDNGKGFDPHRPTRADSFGLTGMRERAQSMGGQLTVASRPGQGTEVVVVAPTAASDMTGGLL
jgi:PAS domain S-box-containing protein